MCCIRKCKNQYINKSYSCTQTAENIQESADFLQLIDRLGYFTTHEITFALSQHLFTLCSIKFRQPNKQSNILVNTSHNTSLCKVIMKHTKTTETDRLG